MSKASESKGESTGSISNHPVNARELDFRTIRENRDRWDRALESTYEIERGGRPDLFVVWGSDEPIPQNCSLTKTGETYSGWCSCETFASDPGSDDPDRIAGSCRHLIAIRQRAVLDYVSIPETSTIAGK